jgi:hypothetical protein
VKSKLLKLVNLLRLGNDVVYNPKSTELNPDYGYMVGVNRSAESFADVEASDLRSYITRSKHQFYQLGRYLGAYHSDGAYLLVISELVKSKNDALVLASVRKESFIFDNATKEIIYLHKQSLN